MSKFIWGFLIPVFLFTAFRMVEVPPQQEAWKLETPLHEVLISLGEPEPKHNFNFTPEMVTQGEEIVKTGRTTLPNGSRSKRVSKYYVCTTCHNLEQEDPDLRYSDPETRLPYVKAKGIPFLQGTTFKGIVNRETWYNDDYVRKYGEESIGKAHRDLREAIQLCAVECSQGRSMEDWEIDAVLAYYWSLQFTLDDLQLSDADLEKLNQGKNDPKEQQTLIYWLKTFYLQKSPAHFYDSAPNKRKGYEGYAGNPARGKDIYELSCLHCHKYEGVSHYVLDESKLSFRDIKRMIPRNSHFSLYQIIPYGTYAIPGHRPYMPHYPAERMSKQQVEDLRRFVEQQAK